MKKIIYIVIVMVIIGVGYKYFRSSEKKEEISYKNFEVKKVNVKDYVETLGQIEPLNRVEILPPTSGRIEKIFVEEGSVVKSGDVLCLMSSSDRVAILDAARSISDEEYKKWEENYKPIKILASINGRVILRNIVEGQTVGASTVLFAISDVLIAIANVDESDIGKIKNGDNAFITLDAYPHTTIKGRVFQILDEGKNVSNVIIYRVKIKIDNPPAFIKSNMTASIKIITSRKEILGIPSNSVEYSKDGKAYIVTGFDNKKNPIKKEIVVGRDYDNLVEVKKGIEEGDVIYLTVKKYSKQSISSGSNPFMPQRRSQQQRQVMRRI